MDIRSRGRAAGSAAVASLRRARGALARGGQAARRALVAGAVVVLAAQVVARPAAAQCAGDCDGDDQVRIDELLTGVAIAIDGQDVGACAALDTDGDGRVVIHELLAAVGHALDGCGVPLGRHVCALAESSRLDLRNGLPLSLRPEGALAIECGPLGARGRAHCACAVTEMAAIVIPAIGDVCIQAAPGCERGLLDCAGEQAADARLVADHDVGACAGNPDCALACAASCAARDARPLASSCEGYCQGGTAAGAACGSSDECPQGVCAGGAPVAHPGVCQCQCVATGEGVPPPGGSLTCALGLQLDIEVPSDGACGTAAALRLPPWCLSLTTASASARLENANGQAGSSRPPGPAGRLLVEGAGPSCEGLGEGALEGLTLVGGLALFDMTLGDLVGTVAFACR